ncbi:MAG: sugar-binding domain-containing protein, partial [Actinobacteria bacterium]|nr:sugar-binding domain-containing protein [Actinomycetota bacterium]
KITRDLLVREKSIKEIFEYFKRLNIAIVSIDAIYHKTISSLVKTHHITEDELKYLKKKGAVGDVCMHFFDANGKIIENNMGGKLIAIPAEDFMRVPYSIGIVGGTRMAEAIYGALKGKFINVLITDYVTAQKVFELENNISKIDDIEREPSDIHYKGGQLVIS